MSEAALRLKDELLRLPEEDRRQIANWLWDLLDVPTEDDPEPDHLAWTAELERRSKDAEATPTEGQPFREVIAELRGELP
jgi:putative addiction module component (TIGR02574 family)